MRDIWMVDVLMSLARAADGRGLVASSELLAATAEAVLEELRTRYDHETQIVWSGRTHCEEQGTPCTVIRFPAGMGSCSDALEQGRKL